MEFTMSYHVAPILVAAATLGLGATSVQAQTALPFTLDWKYEGPAAPYTLAISEGYYADEGLQVTISEGNGSLDAIPKVATGAFPVGFTDINSLMKFLDQNPDAPVIGVMMVYDQPPFAVVGRKSLGIESPKDLEGKVLGAPPTDGAWAQFPILAAEQDLDMSQITIEPLGFPVREPMLAEGKVAAVTGFSFTSSLSTERLGVPADDIVVLQMSDYGVALYGNVVIANTDFAQANPEAITGFIRATAKGWREAIADPETAIETLVAHNPAIDRELELRRFDLSVSGTVNTPYVQEHGMGNIDPDRFARSIEQMKLVYDFQNEPDAARYFDASYLPDADSLMLQ